ncbi:coiled-coil domain-containing protein [Archaeoglobus fulgidus]|uniref:Uncharacterized protein n=1 Tax=Archaeoglobus fulgidus (strain ATCC 49558 / DSM 4304 / JCM 9628 / NBRC 100126 / VC-16) TaxID=224325 RepID=O29317_ARCFU|nr:hypothetical protein [Archaeoglobus fulgidus]AAB90313.1 predicted coding region AF_0945 [Archaeoglobus fulgidus DSM 4304]
MKKLMLILCLVVLIAPTAALETLTKDNFATPDTQVSPEKDYYFPGDTVSVDYIILPKTEDDMKLIGGEDYKTPRTYTFETALENPYWTIVIRYNYGSATKSEDFTGNKVKVDVYGLVIEGELKGVKYIEANLTGRIPSVTERVEEIDLVSVSVEQAEEDALPPLTVKVVNVQKFSEDISKVRADADKLKSDLDSAGVSYNQSDFDEVYSLLDEAYNLYIQGKYLEADDKINQAEEKLDEIASQADRLKAETLRSKLKDSLDNAYLNLSMLEVALNKIENSQNYTNYLQSYAELKSRYDDVKKDYDAADDLYKDGKYSDAYNSFKELEDDISSLLSDIMTLREKVDAEVTSSPTQGGFGLPALNVELPISPLYLAAALVVAAVAIVAAIKLRGGRRKWDELR